MVRSLIDQVVIPITFWFLYHHLLVQLINYEANCIQCCKKKGRPGGVGSATRSTLEPNVDNPNHILDIHSKQILTDDLGLITPASESYPVGYTEAGNDLHANPNEGGRGRM